MWWHSTLGWGDGGGVGRGAPAVVSWGSSPLWLLLAYCVVYFHVVFVGVVGFYLWGNKEGENLHEGTSRYVK